MALVVRQLTSELWPALEDLFGRQGASNGCWCMYWRIGPGYARRARDDNRADFQRIADADRPPGLLALDRDIAVGSPRRALPWLDRARFLSPIDAADVWSISCFYIRRSWRRRGVTAALIEAAATMASEAGASILEAYPVDKTQPSGASNAFTGVASTFERAGFREVARRSPARPIMRLELKTPIPGRSVESS
jgi:GNAT superfamily N-acetyltransferase